MEVPIPKITTSDFFNNFFICSVKAFPLSIGINLRSNLISAWTKRNSNSKVEPFEDDLTLGRVCPQNIHDLEILVGLAPLFSEIPSFLSDLQPMSLASAKRVPLQLYLENFLPFPQGQSIKYVTHQSKQAIKKLWRRKGWALVEMKESITRESTKGGTTPLSEQKQHAGLKSYFTDPGVEIQSSLAAVIKNCRFFVLFCFVRRKLLSHALQYFLWGNCRPFQSPPAFDLC